ncbi:MAG: nickel pincer cofactor biosynthesis protein LarC [Lachnospiraceae bacterium]|nr:nickel pincer cofactor biosynthesis protein LarC [Lachnospiraceae bacterium]
MKTLYFDCSMGAAGDMLTGALYELLDEKEKKEFIGKINGAGIEGVKSLAEPSEKCGIKGTHFRVLVEGHEEGHDHEDHHHEDHHHDDHHEGHHHHSGLHDIEDMIGRLEIPANVKKDAVSVYKLIAEAESHAHGKPVTDIHFHEVGTKDAVADVVSVCLLIDMIKPDKVMASNINVGSGQVKCAHGILPVPAPATAYILKDVPIYQGKIESELCTPTGAALLKYFVSEYSPMPVIRVVATGYGMGTRDFDRANCLRAFLGKGEYKGSDVIEFTCSIDDMTGERVGYAMEALFRAGALEVYTIPIGMKKSRPGIELNVMCREEDRDKILRLILKHTTTLGVRETVSTRYALKRRIEERETQFGPVRCKISEGYGIKREKWEYDDIARIAVETESTVAEVISKLNADAKDR